MKRKGSQGFVLVNALVLVAALSAVAVMLLARAEAGRQRQIQMQTSAQLDYYLDAYEALSITILQQDQRAGPLDHLQEDWTQAAFGVPLDRGQVTGVISDLQGKFNVNALANPDDGLARQGFEALIKRVGLSPTLGEAIVAHLAPKGTQTASGTSGQYGGGGPVAMLDQLKDIPTLRSEELSRLGQFAAALPSNTPLNVNTASTVVLQSLFSQISPAMLDRLIQDRRTKPFISAEDFQQRMIDFGASEAAAALDLARITVSSRWFAIEMSAMLDDHRRQRVTVFERKALPEGPRVSYRVTTPG